jgi:lipoprotein-anchoring transpeptidase ErfK/SrfK
VARRDLPARLTVGLLAALTVGCGSPGGEDPRPDGLAFDSQITFTDGRGGAGIPGAEAATGEQGASTTVDGAWVVVGHATVPEVVARRAPAGDAAVVAELANPTEIGGPLVFQLVETDLAAATEWVEVHLPIRPNGTTGWVRLDELELSRNPYRIEIDVSQHRLRVLVGGVEWLSATVAIGTGSTPTPRGRFYITELLQPPDPGGLYGPFAFGLSGYSETLRSFAGGDGVIGIHGTDDPDSLGSDVSHGCVRVDNAVITTMAGVIPLGTPVRIV